MIPARLIRTLGLAAAAAGLSLGLGVVPATAAGTAKVNVVHGIPGVDVKVCVDGKPVVDDFAFGDTVVGAALSARTHRVRIVAAGAPCRSTAILKSPYELAAGANYTIVAHLDAGATPRLTAYANKVRPTDHGQARLTVRHTAQAPAVNVWAGGTKLVKGTWFTSGKSKTFAVPADTYRVKVTLPGSTAAVIGPASLTVKAGRAYQVYAVGAAGDYRLVTVKVPVGTS